MTDHISDFIAHMRNCGCGPAEPDKIISDDKRRRFRLDGDKAKTQNGSYQVKVDGDFAVGWCMSFKEGVAHAWHSKSDRRWSDEDKAKWKKERDLARARRDVDAADVAKLAARKAAQMWAAGATTGTTGYLDRKGVGLNGARIWNGKLIVPLRSGADLVGLQIIHDDGVKRFLTGTPKEGAYFSIARKNDDLSTIIICEGFATGADLRTATGCPVIVAFDAGNLAQVAKAIRARYHDASIIIAADNDQWTTKPDGTPWNPGIEKAHAAAAGIGGARVIAPQVPSDDPARRTDWNDIAQSVGIEEVRLAMTSPEPLPETLPGEDRWEPDYEAQGDAYNANGDPLALVRPLGHNRGLYYFFPRASGQIVALSAQSMGRMQSLYMLAPRYWWVQYYGGDKVPDAQICAHASAHLIHACHLAGIFQPESTRGVGAWRDGDRVVVNCGDVIRADGLKVHPASFMGDAVYESGPAVINMDVDPLSNREAARLRDVCRMLQWKRPQFADLLAGWLVVAPVGSALKWRPHIWLTGRSGAGKSTIVEELVKPVLGSIAIKRDGGTSEAGVRKTLGASGRPYVLDEAESENSAQRIEMEKIVQYARKSSSGGVVENANAAYQARSCFCFSAINPRVEQVADQSRITLLELVPDNRPDRDARFAALIDAVHEMLHGEFGDRLFARTVANMPALLRNIETFGLAASAMFGSKRDGQQFGPMLAGAYSLTSTREITLDAAQTWMASQDWNWHSGATDDQDADAARLVTHIMTARVRYDVLGVGRESAIGEMVGYAADPSHAQHDGALRGLKPYGIKVHEGMVLIANQSPNLRRLLSDTAWIPWGRTLSDYPGAGNGGGKAHYFMSGLTSKVTSIPLAGVLGQSGGGDEIPIEDDAQGGFF